MTTSDSPRSSPAPKHASACPGAGPAARAHPEPSRRTAQRTAAAEVDVAVIELASHNGRAEHLPRRVQAACRRVPRSLKTVLVVVADPHLLTLDVVLALALARRLLATREQVLLVRTTGPAPTPAAEAILECLRAPDGHPAGSTSRPAGRGLPLEGASQ